MASSTDRSLAAILALALGLPGCLSGHLLDAGRRREIPAAVTTAALDGPDLVLAVATNTVSDLDRPVGEGITRARVRLADLAAAPPIESLAVRFERPRLPLPGRVIPVVASATDAASLPVLVVDDGAPAAGWLHTPDGSYPPLHLDALTRRRYARWVWLVMPAAVAVDAVIVPPLLFFAPAIMVIGD